MQPLISIIIPTYNRARDLERALRSVLAQTYAHWEVLVIDNHSSDNTDDVIKNFNDVRIQLLNIHNDGVIAASRNFGIHHAQGEYVAFLDSDDWWVPQKLEESLKYLEQGAEIVYHDLYIATKLGQRFFWRKARTRELKCPVFNDLICNGNALNNSSVVVKKTFLSAINGLSEERNLIAVEDYDAWLRIATITEKFKKIPRTLGYYWAGGQNVSNPSRTLKTLEAIEERYIADCCDLDWLCYAKGRAYYCLGSYEMAKNFLVQVLHQRAKFTSKIKSVYMLLVGSVRTFYSSRMLP